MSSYISLQQTSILSGITSGLPSSKSLSNRALILNMLGGNRSTLHNLSSARDTRLMSALIGSDNPVIDVMDAGTTMRFLTAYFSVTGQKKTLTGTPRMKERPIKLLVDALLEIGADITYLEKEGFPPIQINGFEHQKADSVTIPGDVSSQYISALMMVAARLPKGLTLHLTGSIGSVPYIQMTMALMKEFGIHCRADFQKGQIRIDHQKYEPSEITIEADWSAASYWFSFVALAKDARIKLPNIASHSLQGDRVVVDIMERLGVKSIFTKDGLELSKKENTDRLIWDFKDCPDLAQTVFPLCAAKGISGEFKGLESLRIKETDRIAALQNELSKIGASLREEATGNWTLTPGQISGAVRPIQTYHDHRMAMGFAPWATMANLTIESPDVVNKSYPDFWKDVNAIGVKTSFLD